jgi:hypothetical protein
VITCRNVASPPRGVRTVPDRPSAELGPVLLGDAMTDLECRLDRFETLAAECELIAKLATDGAKRELYLRLALHYRELVADMHKAIATKAAA